MIGKKGQMKISFGFIVSIILIVIFIMFSFYAIDKFLGIKESVQVGKFSESLQRDVNDVWRSPQGEGERQYIVPNDVEFVCVTDYSSNKEGEYQNFYDDLEQFYYGDENLFFYPPASSEGLDGIKIENIDLEKITQEKNPYCFKNINGLVSIRIKKDFNEARVTLE